MNEKTFANRLKKLRVQHDLSQTGLAEKLECSRSLIGSIENGTRSISKLMAVKLADCFNTDPMYWLDEDIEIKKLQEQNSYSILFDTIEQLKTLGFLKVPSDIHKEPATGFILKSLELCLEIEEKKRSED